MLDFRLDRDIFVLNYFQDCLYTISFFVCVTGFFLTITSLCVFIRKDGKQSKDIYACALLLSDAFCNLTSGYYILACLSAWGYTSWACRSTIYLWRLAPTTSWLLILSIAVSRYVAVIYYNFFKRSFNMKIVLYNLFFIFLLSVVVTIPFPFSCAEVGPTTVDDLKGAERPQKGDWTYKVEHPELPQFNIYVSIYRITLSAIISVCLLYFYGRIFYDLQQRKKARKTIRQKMQQVEQTRTESVDECEIETANQNYEGLRVQMDTLSWFFTGARDHVRNHFLASFGSMGFADDSDIQTEYMFINVAILFVLTNLPYSIIETYDTMTLEPNPYPKLTSCLLLLFVLGFNVNSFIFYFSNVWFHQKMNYIFKSIFFCCRCSAQSERRISQLQQQQQQQHLSGESCHAA